MADDPPPRETSPLEKISDGKAEPEQARSRLPWLRWAPAWVLVSLGAFGAMILRAMAPSKPWAQLTDAEKLRDVGFILGAGLVLWLFRWLAAPAEPKKPG